MANFCTNCGTRIRKEDNFCTNCGTKIDKSDIKQDNHLLKPSPDSIEKTKAKKELKRVVGGRLFYNETFGSELAKNGLDIFKTKKAISQQVEKEIDSGQIKSGGVELRVSQLIQEYKIKNEEEKKILAEKAEKLRIAREREMAEIKAIQEREKARIMKENERKSAKMEENEMDYGGYCDFNCKHCYEEILDSGGGVVGDYTGDGMVEYYCNLGHTLSYGSFCEDYE